MHLRQVGSGGSGWPDRTNVGKDPFEGSSEHKIRALLSRLSNINFSRDVPPHDVK